MISLAKIKDIPEILKVSKETWLATYPSRKYKISRADILKMDFDSPKMIERESVKIKDKSRRIWVAKTSGKIVGYCTAKKGNKLDYIGSMYILPPYQGQGLGKLFMDKMLRWFGKKKDIMLRVAKYNTRAIKFYEKYGFKVTKAKAEAPRLPDGRMMPGIEMTKYVE